MSFREGFTLAAATTTKPGDRAGPPIFGAEVASKIGRIAPCTVPAPATRHPDDRVSQFVERAIVPLLT